MLAAIRKKENFHIFLWLIKDFSWIMNFQILAMIMAVPTVLLSAQLCWISRKDNTELVHNLAVLCWICANVVWMTGEFFFQDGIRHLAAPFFVVGLLILGVYYFRRIYRTPIFKK